jgi:hypothetical protein
LNVFDFNNLGYPGLDSISDSQIKVNCDCISFNEASARGYPQFPLFHWGNLLLLKNSKPILSISQFYYLPSHGE